MNGNNIATKERIRQLLESEQAPSTIEQWLNEIDSADLLHAIFQLTPDEQRNFLSVVSAERAAHIVEDLPSSHSADLIEEMPAQEAAPILEEMASNRRVDVLSEMDVRDSEAILEYLEEEDVQEIREIRLAKIEGVKSLRERKVQ